MRVLRSPSAHRALITIIVIVCFLIIVRSSRPGALQKKGFGVDNVVKMRPGIVYASLEYEWERGISRCE